MQAEADIQPGICGFRTLARAETSDGRAVNIVLETDCDNVTRFAALLAERSPVDSFKEIDPRSENTVLAAGREGRCCTDCIVPASALKAMRVAAELAFPKDALVAISGG
jgi:hypothetical protein